MPMFIVPRWFVALVMYVIVVTIIVLSKPALMFNQDGTFKSSGTGIAYGASPFAASIAFPVIAILCFILASLFKLAMV